jgi:hypothetical protein
MIVHRLVSHFDREVVERASGEIDKAAAAFLPVLGQGEALMIGVDFPIPLAVRSFHRRLPQSRKVLIFSAHGSLSSLPKHLSALRPGRACSCKVWQRWAALPKSGPPQLSCPCL